ncbi:hypothetical protein HDU97_002533 [Phlyctochytrium planicorne]|nr:hypothetical protein HDU97_002533 [Phlyctochytrium planicorne]
MLPQTVRKVAQRAQSTGSFLSIRNKSSLIPPNISSFKEIGRLVSAHPQAHPEIFGKMKSFYARIPKGPKQQVKATTLWGRYYETYMAKDSFMPFVHFLGIMIPVGYSISYFVGGTVSRLARSPVVVSRRSQSTGVFAADNLKKFVPNVKLSGETTLGQVWDGLYTNYKYRLAYPIGIWVGFLWYNLWNPYKSADEKRKIREHEDRLQKLEFHQK